MGLIISAYDLAGGELNVYYIYRAAKKKLRFAAKILMFFAFSQLSYLFNYTLAASADAPIVITDGDTDSESDDGHYPGEPVRVYNSLEDYWQDKLSGVLE